MITPELFFGVVGFVLGFVVKNCIDIASLKIRVAYLEKNNNEMIKNV